MPPIWNGLKKQIFLGDEQFVDKAITQIDIVDASLDLREVPRIHRCGEHRAVGISKKTGVSAVPRLFI